MLRRNPTGRNTFIHFSFCPHVVARCASVAIIAAFWQTPALVSSCTRPESHPLFHKEGQIYIQWTKNPTPEAIDLFFFDTLGAQNLDAYQQVENLEGGTRIYGLSGMGVKRLVALSGQAGNTAAWADIRNYGSLCKKTFALEEEDPLAPRLVAEVLLPDGASRLSTLNLQPMLSQIRIRSVSCDFSGRPYAGKSFFNYKLFLTYAGTEYKPLGPGGGHPVSWINAGSLDSLASLALPQPQMVLQEGMGAIGTQRIYPSRSFSCYANPAGSGAPRTRLVLEGSVDGAVCYYPIEFTDLAPATTYTLDLTLRRMGSAHPDLPVQSGTVLLQTLVQPWDQRPSYTVSF